MWYYFQKTGVVKQDGMVEACGYSGKGKGKNNPESENIPFVGPIPKGIYTIESPREHTKHGPYAIPLEPNPNNKMFGRDAFLIHGDSMSNPGNASEGCIILSKEARERIIASMDNQLTVL